MLLLIMIPIQRFGFSTREICRLCGQNRIISVNGARRRIKWAQSLVRCRRLARGVAMWQTEQPKFDSVMAVGAEMGENANRHTHEHKGTETDCF